MARKNTPHRIGFTEAASIDELIEALQELREKAGGAAKPRVRTTVALNVDGGHVTRITAEA
ncbi:hypothetical protein [Lentzea sp. NPDC059081]|uniref:hypothetical protein n=1 Tax=Lentzea sp. NPDC059081 TaxID=3346719 RepID=UPI00368D7964